MNRLSWGAVQPFRSASAAAAGGRGAAGDTPRRPGPASDLGEGAGRGWPAAANLPAGGIVSPDGAVSELPSEAGPSSDRAGSRRGIVAPGGPSGTAGGDDGAGSRAGGTAGEDPGSRAGGEAVEVDNGRRRVGPASASLGSGPARGCGSLAAVAGRGGRASGCARRWRREGWCERRLIGRGRRRRSAAGWSGSWARVEVPPGGPPGRPMIADRPDSGRAEAGRGRPSGPWRAAARRAGLSRGGWRCAGRRRGRRRRRWAGSPRRSGRGGNRRRPSC